MAPAWIFHMDSAPDDTKSEDEGKKKMCIHEDASISTWLLP